MKICNLILTDLGIKYEMTDLSAKLHWNISIHKENYVKYDLHSHLSCP